MAVKAAKKTRKRAGKQPAKRPRGRPVGSVDPDGLGMAAIHRVVRLRPLHDQRVAAVAASRGISWSAGLRAIIEEHAG